MSFALLQDANLVLYILLQYPPHRHDVIWFICFVSLLCLLRGIGDPSSLWRVLVVSPVVSLSPRSLTPDRSPALLVLGFPSPFDPPRPRLPWLARWPGAPRAVRSQGCNRDAGLCAVHRTGNMWICIAHSPLPSTPSINSLALWLYRKTR